MGYGSANLHFYFASYPLSISINYLVTQTHTNTDKNNVKKIWKLKPSTLSLFCTNFNAQARAKN